MRFHYAGKYSGNPADLPQCEPVPGAVQFKEAKDTKELGKIANSISIILVVVTLIIIFFRMDDFYFSPLAILLYLVSLLPHEFLHAICYKEDVYMYQDLKHGMLFVTGTEKWTKGRFILKCLLPGIVLGFIPFIAFLIDPDLVTLGQFGALGIAGAAGDFYNAFNAAKQMPAGSMAYLDQEHTYWYMPESKSE